MIARNQDIDRNRRARFIGGETGAVAINGAGPPAVIEAS